MTKIKSKISSFLYNLLGIRVLVFLPLLILMLKFSYIMTGTIISFEELRKLFIAMTVIIYFDKNNSWNKKEALFDSQDNIDKGPRTLYYSRFLLLFDFMIMLIIIKKTLDLASHHNFFSFLDLIIITSLISLLAIGKLIFNRNVGDKKIE